MRTTALTTLYWTLAALGLLAVAVTDVDLVGTGETALGQSLAGLLPEPVFLVLAGVLSLVLAATAAAPARRRDGGSALPPAAGGIAAAALVLLVVSVDLLGLIGYLPLAVAMAPFDESMREALGTVLEPGIVSQVVVLLGVLLWGRAVRLRSEEHTSELQSRGHLVCRL